MHIATSSMGLLRTPMLPVRVTADWNQGSCR